MSLRTKLTIGLAFLFLIIFGLAIYSSLSILELPRFGGQVRACGRGDAPVLLFIHDRAFIVQR